MLAKVIFCIFLIGIKFVAAAPELKLVRVLISQATEYSFPAHLAVSIPTDEDLAMDDPVFQDMTNEEKIITYKEGTRLRDRYSSFLGDAYSPELTQVYTTDRFVSKMSGALLNAGLWPPAKSQQWSQDFFWQPIPYDYTPHEEDTLLMGRFCPAFLKATNRVRNTAEILSLEKNYRDLFLTIGEETGLEISNSRDIAYLYKSLAGRASRNLTLPLWTAGIFPDGAMLNVTYLEDFVLSKSDLQVKLNGGFLLREIIRDAEAIARGNWTDGRKMITYCGDSELFIGVMHALGTWHPHVPNVASALIFEFYYDNVSRADEIKILYDTGKNELTIPLTVPGCKAGRNTSSCRLDDLVNSISNILPDKEEDKVLCGRSIAFTTYGEEMETLKVTGNIAARITCGVFIVSSILILPMF